MVEPVTEPGRSEPEGEVGKQGKEQGKGNEDGGGGKPETGSAGGGGGGGGSLELGQLLAGGRRRGDLVPEQGFRGMRRFGRH